MEAIIPAYDTYILDRTMYITHKGAHLAFKSDKVIRARMYDNDPKVMYHINWYWSGLSPEKQDEIFNVYTTIHALLQREPDTTFENLPLVHAIRDLVDLHPIEEMYAWITKPGVLVWPDESEIPREFDQAAQAKYSRDKNFVYQDYQDLMAFVLQLRVITPIWGEFLGQYDKVISHPYRDMVALQLASESAISESPGYKKLEKFVDAMVASRATLSTSGSLEFISSVDYPAWIFSNTVMRRLTGASFYQAPEDRSAFLVKVISNHVKDLIDKSVMDFKAPTEKRETGESSRVSDESQNSNFENVRIKQRLSGGDNYFLQWYVGDLPRLAKELEPDINMGLVKDFLNMYAMGTFVPDPNQVLVLQWVLAPVISPQAAVDLTRINVAQCLAVAGAVLWHRDHKILSAFVTSGHSRVSMDANVSGDTVSRMNNQIYDELPVVYPYQRRAKSSEKSYKGIIDTVKTFVDEISRFAWHPTLPTNYIEEIKDYVSGTDSYRTLILPNNMRPLVVEALIDLAKRPLPDDIVPNRPTETSM